MYSRPRGGSPPLSKKTTDYRGTNPLGKLPNLDLNKTQKKRPGNETFSESDHEDRDTLSNLRSNYSRPAIDTKQRDQSFNLPSVTSTGSFNQKKKVPGSTGFANDISTKKSNENELKSFRSSYEQLSEEAPFSTGLKKTTKYDDLASRSYTKPTLTTDLSKRINSPLIHDAKPFNSSTTQKRANASDDDDDEFNLKSKPKVIRIFQIEYRIDLIIIF